MLMEMIWSKKEDSSYALCTQSDIKGCTGGEEKEAE